MMWIIELARQHELLTAVLLVVSYNLFNDPTQL